MASSAIRALEIAPEPKYCNLTDGVPTTTGLTFQSVEFIDASQVSPVSETMQDSEDGGKAGYYGYPPDILKDGSGQIIKKGEISLDFYLRPRNETSLLYDGLRALLATRFKLHTTPAYNNTQSASVTAVSTNTVTVDKTDFASVGQVVAFQSSETAPTFYAHVISATNGGGSQSLTVIPAMTGVVSVGDYARPMVDFRWPTFGGDPVRSGSISPFSTSAQPTVCLRLTGDGWRQICYGCQLTSLTISGTDGDSRAVKMTATINVAYAEDVAAATPPVGQKYGGPIEHSLAAPLMVSDSYSAGTAPTTALTASEQPCVDEWTATFTWTCESSNCGNLWLGKAPLEAVNLECSLDMFLGGTSKQTALAEQFMYGQFCGLVLGFSSQGVADTATGGALVIPAAYINSGTVSTVDLGSGFVRTHVEFAVGPNTLDETGDKPMIQLAIA